MHRRVVPILIVLAGVLLLLAGCDLAAATPTPVPPPPTATTVAPTPTLAPPPPPREVSFTTEDGVTLKATLYGSGATAVVLSHMNKSNRGTWRPLAERLAAQGYLVLAYDFRGQGESEGRNTPGKIDTDLRAAIAFARAQGATTIVLGGASLGGMATGLVAAQEQAAAFFIMSSPRSALGVDVTDDRFQSGAAKLFLNTEGDLYNADIHQMYAVAAPPKEEQYYPGQAHGVEMFDQEYGPTVLDRLVRFIVAHAPPG